MNNIQEEVILVDEKDRPRGTMEKMEAHVKGELHRAISVFIFNEKGEMLIHQRAMEKYHCPGLWTNTACSHPREMEQTADAASRRLQEEMGMQADLLEIGTFVYRAEFDNGLIEHELDHVFVGISNNEPQINPEEVKAYKWVNCDELVVDIAANPQKYTAWFKIIMKDQWEKMERWLNK